MSGLIPFSTRGTGVYKMFDELFDDRLFTGKSAYQRSFKLDIHDDEKSYTVEAELAGVSKENINIEVDKDILTISTKIEEETKNYLHRERSYSASSRSVRLSHADMDNITAKMENGILTVSVPKTNTAVGARRIDIG